MEYPPIETSANVESNPETYKSPFYAYKIPIHPNDKYKPIIFLHKSPRLNLQWFIRYIYHKIKP